MFALTALAYPCVLALLCVGAGLLIDRVSGSWLPGMLLAVVGAAALIAVSQLTTYVTFAAAATPYALAPVAVAGFALGWAAVERFARGMAAVRVADRRGCARLRGRLGAGPVRRPAELLLVSGA